MTPMSPILFPPFRLDLVNECVWRETQQIPLRGKTFAVLRCLVEHAGQLVSKEALLNAVWPQTYVSDVVLMVCIRELRQVLGDDAKQPQFIETVHRRGYRFIGPVQSLESRVQSQNSQPTLSPQHPTWWGARRRSRNCTSG